MSRTRTLFLATVLVGCHRSPPPSPAGEAARGPARSAPSAAPFASGAAELVPGSQEAYGFPLPKGLDIVASFPGSIHAAGNLPGPEVTKYVETHVDAARVELGGAGIVFPAVHVRGGDATKVLRIEVNSAGPRTELVVKNVTALPKKDVDPSLPEAERWRRAGLNPDGTPIDPSSVR